MKGTHILLSAEIVVGYVQPSVNVSESDGVAQLTVNTSMPSGGIPNELSIFLIVDTSDETAIGLEFRVGFSVLYSPLYPCFYDNGWNIDSIYSQEDTIGSC